MSPIQGSEKIVNPLQKSALHKKGLCDYVINVASGCLHGCTFCYVPSTPAIRTKQSILVDRGVSNPQMDWGNYLFIREEAPEKLREKLSRHRSWSETPSGKGVVLLCSGTDPYQNQAVAKITREAIKVLLEHGKRVRILTRSPLWLNDLDLLADSNVTIGMSIPYLANKLSRKIEPNSPPPSLRLEALSKGKEAGCRVYVAMAPTHPEMDYPDFKECLEAFKKVEPEVIFWEPINARGTNGKRMVDAGLKFAKSIMTSKDWAECFVRQWTAVEKAAEDLGILDLLHIWPDRELSGFVSSSILEYWWDRPTLEKWKGLSLSKEENRVQERPRLIQHVEL